MLIHSQIDRGFRSRLWGQVILQYYQRGAGIVKSKIERKWSGWTWGWLAIYPLVWQLNSIAAIAAPIKLRLPPPPPRGIAGNRAAAASRAACPTVAHALTALVPEYRSPQANRVWGLTGVERPTFWFYVPYAKAAIVDISFTLQDESNPADTKIVYQDLKLAPHATPGLMGIVLPKSSTPLVPNKPYHWFLTLNMNCTVGQRPLFVDGWVQRQDLASSLKAQIDRATPTAKIALAAENGLWYDALTTLANLRATKPQDPALSQDWQTLLDSIDLGALAAQPVSEHRPSQRVERANEPGF